MTKPLRIDGVDISHYQSGAIDWTAAKKAGVKFVFHKATQDDDYADDRYAARRKELKAAGLPFGAYHFAEPAKGDAAEEAKHFLELAKPAPGDLRPVLDLEENDHNLSRADLTKWVGTWVSVVKKAVGVEPIIYTSYDLDDTFDCLLWQPRYNSTNTPPETASPWKRWDIWQFSNGQYGVPNSVPGIGHCDINHMRDGLELADLLIPEPAPTTVRRSFGHLSGHVYDTDEHRLADFDKLFSLGYDIVTWTEAADIETQVKALADKHGYRVSQKGRGDGGVAVRTALAKPKSFEAGSIHVLDSAPATGDPHPYGPKDITWLEYEDTELGVVAVCGGIHFLTMGRWKGQAQEDAPNDPVDHFAANTLYAHMCGDWAVEHGKGSALAFVTGDTNLVDAKVDVFRGAPLTTCWDELDIHPNTGHGNIDVIASYNEDGRVRCVSARVFTDAQQPFHSDHFLIEAVFEIKLRKEAA